MQTSLFLGSLVAARRVEIENRCTVVELPAGEQLFSPTQPLRHVYFLTSGIASTFYGNLGMSLTEIGMTGRDGIVGAFECLGLSRVSITCTMQQPGAAQRILIADFQKIMRNSHDITNGVHHVIQKELHYLSIVARCNQLHPASQRLSRYLLMMADHTDSSTFCITHESLSKALGALRTTISIAASSLKKTGMISYARGKIVIHNRLGLESAACSCYRESKRECF